LVDSETYLEKPIMYRILVACLLVALVVDANAAGYVVDARVVQVRVDSDGRGMVIFDKPIVGTPPACVIPLYSNSLAFGGPGGKSVMAFALLAKATNMPLAVVYGMGTCNQYGSVVEDWNYGQ
jgi:hypothetical protein